MTHSTNRILAVTAAVLGLGALVAGDATRAAVAAQHQVSPVQLAEWIRARNERLRIIDVRDSAAFSEYRIPTAEHVAADQVAGSAFTPDQLVVLYATDSDPVAEWSSLKKRGLNVKVLSGGLSAWLTDIMNPQMPPNATAGQKQHYDRKKEMAEYFGGQASVYSEPRALSPSTMESLKRLKRRTC